MLDATLQVRVRRKNPLIERKASDRPDEVGLTRSSFTNPWREAPPARGARPREALDDQPSGETTKEIERAEPERPRRDRRSLGVDPAVEQRRRRSPATGREPPPRRARAQPPSLGPSAVYLDDDATEIADHSPMSPDRAAALGAPLPRRKPGRPGVSRVSVNRADAPRIEGRRAEAARTEAPRTETPPRKRAIVAASGGGIHPVPRHLLGKWGTDAVGAAAQRAQIDRLDEALPEVRTRALKVVRGNLDQVEIDALDAALQGAFDDRGTDPSMSPKRSLEHLINERAYAELAAAEQAKLLKAIAPDPRDIATIKSAIALLKTGVAKKLRQGEREQLFEAFVALDSESRALIARIAARGLRGRSTFEDRDFYGVGAVTHLFQLASGRRLAPEMERAGLGRSRITSLVLGSLAHPARLPFEEAGDGVLGVLEFALADSSPAELMRLWLDLVGPDMRADLAGGVELDLEAAARSDLEISSRNTPFRLALAQLARRARPRRSAKVSADPFMMPGNLGFDADLIARALELLYGVPFTVAAGGPSALRHLERIDGDPSRLPPVFVSLLYSRGERLFLLDRIEDSTVFLRAPHGRSTKRRGAERIDPPRMVVDPEIGLESVPWDELEPTLGVALIPRT